GSVTGRCVSSRSPTARTRSRTSWPPTTSASSSSGTRSWGAPSPPCPSAGSPRGRGGNCRKLRAAIVNMSALADAARDLGLGRFVLLGRGEEMSGGRDKSSILADALEAVLGAVYLDRDLPAARKLIERVFRPRMIAYVRGEGERD